MTWHPVTPVGTSASQSRTTRDGVGSCSDRVPPALLDLLLEAQVGLDTVCRGLLRCRLRFAPRLERCLLQRRQTARYIGARTQSVSVVAPFAAESTQSTAG